MNALCIGGAACVWGDLAQVPMGWADETIICNDMGATWAGEFHWATLHPENLVEKWFPLRDSFGLPHDYHLWLPEGVREHLEFPSARRIADHWHGSSGLFCVRVAVDLGATQIVCAGIPMTNTPHNHQPYIAWTKAHTFHEGWVDRKAAGDLENVTSLSGWTADLLGRPTF